MRCWWERNRDVRLAGYTKHETEDITGSVPLLLDGCVVNGDIDLLAFPLIMVSEEVLKHMRRRQSLGISESPSRLVTLLGLQWVVLTSTFIRRYWEYMNACVVNGAVPKSMPFDDVDHRYSFETIVSGVMFGSYTCGAAREAVAKGLRRHGGAHTDYRSLIRPLRSLTPYSPSVAEFFAKQAVLSLIERHGFGVGDSAFSSLNTTLYPGDFPEMGDIGERPRLFCPLKPGFGGIDGIIISIDREWSRCHLLPLQVTTADARDSSEILFFSQWSHWINTLGLQVKDVDVEYIWVVGSGSPSTRYFSKQTRQRQGIKFLNPKYTRQTVTLRDLSPEISSELRYAQTRRRGWASYPPFLGLSSV